jgi:hypothetical protein
MRVHRFEITVVVQQGVAVLDAIRADDEVDRLADRHPFVPQETIVARYLNRDVRIQYRHDIERSQVPGK